MLTTEQKRIVFHAGYEWWMFKCSHDLLLDVEPRYAEFKHDPVRNTLVEAAAIHGRALVSFFYGTPQKPTDWHVTKLDPSLSIGWASLPAELDQWREDANLRVAHLTEARKNALKEWNVPLARSHFQKRVDAMKVKLGSDMPTAPPDWLGDDRTESGLLVVPRLPPGSIAGPSQPTGPGAPTKFR